MRERLLVIDSVATNRIVMNAKLRAAYYEVALAETVPDALAEIIKSRPDLILLAAEQGQPDSLNLCTALKLDPSTHDIPIIVTTGDDLAVAAFEAGADDVVYRPFDDHVMLSRLRKLLRSRDQNAALKITNSAFPSLSAPALPDFKNRNRISGHVTIVACQLGTAEDIEFSLAPYLSDQMRCVEHTDLLSGHADVEETDVIVIAGPENAVEARLGLLSEMRSRRRSRHARVIVLLPPSQRGLTAQALDMGADDATCELIAPSELAARISYLVECKHRTDHLRRVLHDGLKMAATDPLTGLHNRRFATHKLEEISHQAKSTDQQFAVLVLDIDHFKSINDTHGHATGDDVLIQVAGALKSLLREDDLIARIGGEEFLIALPQITLEQARDSADRLRRNIESMCFSAPQGDDFSLTMSIGVTMGTGALPMIELINNADRALYISKARGRNRVSIDGQAA